MIALVKYYMLRARLKLALIVGLIGVALFFAGWHYLSSDSQPARLMLMATSMAFMIDAVYLVTVSAPQFPVEEEEFDLVLPIRRRTIFLARSLAWLLLLVVMSAPFCAVILVVSFHTGRQHEVMWPCATVALYWLAWLMMNAPVLRLVRRLPPLLNLLIFAFFLMTMMAVVLTPLILMDEVASPLLPLTVAVFLAALVLILAGRHFERLELAPNRDAGPTQEDVARTTFIDRFPPMIRVLAHAVWLQWWFPLLVALMTVFGFMLRTNRWTEYPHLFFFCAIGIFALFFVAGKSLLPIVPRRTILRSVLGPIAAAPLLIGCVEALAEGSAQAIVRGLALALAVLVTIWFMLPSMKEYRRPFLLLLRYSLGGLLLICILIYVNVPSLKTFIPDSFSITWSQSVTWAAGNMFLVSSGIVLAIALLWWRCERKFRHFEPFAMSVGF